MVLGKRYRIEGDGSHQHTKVFADDKEIQLERLRFEVSNDLCRLIIDDEVIPGEQLDLLILRGVYTVMSQGRFDNTRVWIFDEQLRGVQNLVITIEKNKHPRIVIDSILLPNLVETNV